MGRVGRGEVFLEGVEEVVDVVGFGDEVVGAGFCDYFSNIVAG